MVIISKAAINEFSYLHPDAVDPLLHWYYYSKLAEWSKFSDVKESFNTVDYIGNDLYVFDIGGNKYRLIARIFFRVRTVYIRFIGTHKEYDKIKPDSL
ncbi:MAG: type II toxin-antitoxin system HigB family toxin [Chitinophaga sp.]|uniref:type II toxin-antitoxin system HigB family toxin n=1 Tax=Chitinophaga sp. TaxID=1869181 RepID=UPI001B0EAAEA|nr:type II toxin-antitoxin system HigB family toxin [Chitinophaga sp.]MBO9727677.1 type II toxin-antitoxin system HigB family toxin [Chitinophaga sp.]